jgi:hypothetical protein
MFLTVLPKPPLLDPVGFLSLGLISLLWFFDFEALAVGTSSYLS